MTYEEAIKLLKTDGCGNCSWGASDIKSCKNKEVQRGDEE